MTPVVAGCFVDRNAARGAVEALQERGIEAADIAVIGEGITRASSAMDTRTRDHLSVQRVTRRVVLGAVVGTICGAIVGLVVSAFLPGSPVAFAIGGALALGAIGGVVMGVQTPLAEEWELTFEPQPGEVVVAVHADDPKTVRTAAEVLRAVGAREVRGSEAA